jgi:hypothetical protein
MPGREVPSCGWLTGMQWDMHLGAVRHSCSWSLSWLAQDAAARLREVREEAAVKEEQWQKEVAMAQRMAQLYRESGEERARKCTEMEGVVQELKAHLEVMVVVFVLGGPRWLATLAGLEPFPC